MPRPLTILCRSCPATVPVGARGPVPRLCPGCQQAAKLRALLPVVETVPVGVEGEKLARDMNSARMRLIRRARKEEG